MLDQIDLVHKISKREYKQRLPDLQARLYGMEQALLEAHLPALIVFEGWAGTSKITTIGTLMRRLDPRGLRVHPITPPRTYETQYPWLHRFWLKTPKYGQMALFDRSWYRQVLADRTRGKLDGPAWRSYCEDIVSFERQLADDGAVILKFWLHISRKEQGRRFRKLLGDRLTAWQVTEEDRWQHRHYKRVRAAVEDLLTRTDAPHAPWIVLPATDKRYTRIAVFETILAALEARLGHVAALQSAQDDEDDVFDGSGPALRRELAAVQMTGAAHQAAINVQLPAASEDGCVAVEQSPLVAALPTPSILQHVDLQQKIDKEAYDHDLKRLQAKMHLLGFQVYLQQRPVILVFEGWDAAGKGGAIHRVIEKVDPRSYIVHTIAAPTGDDKAHHYLYRFWRRLPPRGVMAIFDRSWYGRVLVERVEGFATEGEWRRAYGEINAFEQMLVENNTVVLKCFLHISKEEQKERLQARLDNPAKLWKFDEGDLKERARWPEYRQAYEDALSAVARPTHRGT